MFKKLAFPAVALMALLIMFVPSQASARVRFGIAIGAAPVYPAPVSPYAYANPYPAYPDYYEAPAPVYPAYPYVAPYSYATPYVAPYTGFGFSFGGHHDWDRHRDWDRHERHEFREHEEGRWRR